MYNYYRRANVQVEFSCLLKRVVFNKRSKPVQKDSAIFIKNR